MELSLSLVSSSRKTYDGLLFLEELRQDLRPLAGNAGRIGIPFPGLRPHGRSRKELCSIPRADRMSKLLVIGFEMAC